MKGDDDFGFAGRLEFGKVERLKLFLVNQNDIDSFLELIDDVGLQVLVEGHKCIANATPGGVNIDDDQFGVFLVVVMHEVVGITDYCC